MKTRCIRSVWWGLGVLIFAGSLAAQDLGAVRERMADRLPELDRLKASGVVGETNQGYVELRANKAEAAAVTTGENADRKTVYATIARQAGVTPEAVGRARARQIATQSATGVWLQDDQGEWYQNARVSRARATFLRETVLIGGHFVRRGPRLRPHVELPRCT